MAYALAYYNTVSAIFVQLGFSLGNWQKVQLNTDLLKRRTEVLIHIANGKLKLNEINAIKGLIKSQI